VLIERVNVVVLLLRHSAAAIQRVATSSTTADSLTPATRRAHHAGRHVGQAAAEVSTDVVVNERIGARVAVGQTASPFRGLTDFLCFPF